MEANVDIQSVLPQLKSSLRVVVCLCLLIILTGCSTSTWYYVVQEQYCAEMIDNPIDQVDCVRPNYVDYVNHREQLIKDATASSEYN